MDRPTTADVTGEGASPKGNQELSQNKEKQCEAGKKHKLPLNPRGSWL